MKLITLIVNDLDSNPNLICEFGFSVFIQDEDISLIFDTGQSRKFIKNIKTLNIDPKNIKNIIISHNHYDHSGGLKQYIESFNNSFTLTINSNFFDKKISFSDLYFKILGTNFSQEYLIKKGVKINFINDHIHIFSKNITIFTNFENLNNFELVNKLHYRRNNRTFTLDNMSDEIVLGLDTNSGFFLLCGCSHIGIVNIVENIKKWTGKKIIGIIGGIHLNKSNTSRIYKTAEYLRKENIQYLVLSHCTGKNTLKIFKDFGLNLIPNNTGSTLIL